MINKSQLKKKVLRSFIFSIAFTLTYITVCVNAPSKLIFKNVDKIKIIKSNEEQVEITDKEKLVKFTNQIKYQFILPVPFKLRVPLEDEFIFVFLNNDKIKVFFEYSPKERKLNPYGRPLSSELYNALDSFLEQNFSTNP